MGGAFLQGKQITHNLFIQPTKEAETDRLWKLKKTVYGLSDAFRTWYLCPKKNF